MPPIAAMAPDCTIYLGTFSKSLGGGLRLGYMVVPEPIADAVRAEKYLLGNGNPWLEQATLADFMRSGSYAAHLLRVRSHYKENRDCLVDALRRNFGDVAIDGELGGLHVRLALAARRSRRCDGRGDRAARPGRGILVFLGAGSRRKADRADRPGHHARLCRADAKADRKRYRAPVGCHRRRDRRSRDRHDRLFLEAVGRVRRAAAFAASLVANAGTKTSAATGSTRPAGSSCTLPRITARQGGAPMPVLKNIYRYPIKGLSAQPLAASNSKPGSRFRMTACLRWCVPARRSIPPSRNGARRDCS